MSENKRIDKLFKALADVHRRDIFNLLMLATSAMSLTQIAGEFDMSRQGVTKHVKIMEEAGLIRIHVKGRERFCEANPTPLGDIKDWVAVYDRFWQKKLGDLENFLDAKS